MYIQLFEGELRAGDSIQMMATGAKFQVVEVGRMGALGLMPLSKISAGEVGYLTASIKNVRETRVGDTVTLAARPAEEPLPGYRKVVPMVFCGIYPTRRRQISRPAGRAGKTAIERRLP